MTDARCPPTTDIFCFTPPDFVEILIYYYFISFFCECVSAPIVDDESMMDRCKKVNPKSFHHNFYYDFFSTFLIFCRPFTTVVTNVNNRKDKRREDRCKR